MSNRGITPELGGAGAVTPSEVDPSAAVAPRVSPSTSTWLADPDVTLYHGDVLDILRELPAESVDCCVTSPPYWGLRDYGTGAWEGGDAGCEHSVGGQVQDTKAPGAIVSGQRPGVDASICRKCGATRIDQQLGLEPTPEEYVTRMVEVFREVRRVLAAHGTVWLNLGDSYNAHPSGDRPKASLNHGLPQPTYAKGTGQGPVKTLKPKDLVGVPWRVAFALQADGWYLRSDIVWSKPNPMPESVTDRPTKAHEYVFLLSKQPRYFFDQEAVREPQPTADPSHPGYRPAVMNGRSSPNRGHGQKYDEAGFGTNPGNERKALHPVGRNIRSVWEIATQPYPEAHFATFPEELARRCIAAGTSERGKCPECGAPWVRNIQREAYPRDATVHRGRSDWADGSGRNDGDITRSGQEFNRWRAENPGTETWVRTCDPSCVNGGAFRTQNPCVVLDPFMGSGTVAYVARKLGRHSVGIDLNESYLDLAARRLQQQSLFASEVAGGF